MHFPLFLYGNISFIFFYFPIVLMRAHLVYYLLGHHIWGQTEVRKLLVVLFLMIIIGFSIVGIEQIFNEPEEVIKPVNPNAINYKS